METKTEAKNESCVSQNFESKFIEDSFEHGLLKIDLKQRRLTGGEQETHASNLMSIYTNKDVYEATLKNPEVKKSLEKAKKKGKELDSKDIPINKETDLILRKGTIAVNKLNREVNIKLIAYSCDNSESYGGHFKVNGEDVSFERKVKIINELQDEKFKQLLGNANKLMYPTKLEKEQVKQ